MNSKLETRNSKLFLDGFGDPAGTKAAGADPNAAAGPFLDGMDPLQVGVPSPFGLDVGMAHVMPYHRTLSTDFTRPGHGMPPRRKTNSRDSSLLFFFISY